MLFISGTHRPRQPSPRLDVSISQSRCFSFQEEEAEINTLLNDCFNLAIEMLFMSGITPSNLSARAVHSFQSRNRDAFQFRTQQIKIIKNNPIVSISQSRCFSVQDAKFIRLIASVVVSISQSRCFSVQVKVSAMFAVAGLTFQSRNRDAFHVRSSISG